MPIPSTQCRKTIMCTPREGEEITSSLVRREGNYAHAHYNNIEHYSCLTDIIYVRFISPVVQVSGMMFSVHSI